MAYVSLYRKYRSQTFSDLVGQEHVVRTLQNGISSGRIAHSYLFTGPRGTGKTSTARLLAKALCCEHGPTPEPDNTCEICQAITTGSCIDVVEMDAASESGVDDIREQIVEAVEYRPMVCRYKIFIIDEVHDLSSKAFDALLKTIEEPPPHIIFVLATTEYNKVPPTIRSRCQKHEFRRGNIQDLVGRLEHVLKGEEIKADPAAISAIARMADGGYRDALTLLEQAILVSDGHITLDQVYDQLGLVAEDAIDQIFLAVKEEDVASLINQLESIARMGRDPRAILESMMYRLADLTRASYQVQDRNLDPSRDAALHETSVRLGRDLILRLRNEVSEAHKLIRDISLPRLWLESRLVELARQSALPPTPPPSVHSTTTRPKLADPAPVRSGAVETVVPVKEEPQPSPQTVPEEGPELSGDENLDVARVAWHKTKQKLGEMSAQMRERLHRTSVLSREALVVTIQMERHGDHDWIHDKSNRAPAIAKMFRELFLPDAELKYVVKRAKMSSDEADVVELPLEGQRLEDVVKQIFAQDTPPEG